MKNGFESFLADKNNFNTEEGKNFNKNLFVERIKRPNNLENQNII
ncbi:MAG TPA: hypothetical protein VLL98_02430 [Rickettsiales bacterium]|nr:hypothetical protein [Rickettsiales bacterium]